MPRNALAIFFQRVILSTLPFAGAGCGDDSTEPDLGSPKDMSAVIDFTSPLANCFAMFPPVTVYPDGGLSWDGGTDIVCLQNCPVGYYGGCMPGDLDGGQVELICNYDCFGRRPVGFVPQMESAGCAIGRHFARMAELEAASVVAFAVLAEELSSLDAPLSLIRSARRAMAEERGHFRFAAGLAREHGTSPAQMQQTGTRPLRTAEEFAIENAVEGCVRETFGALLASWQARAAGARRIRTGMATIAVDETGHAELAWAIHGWLQSKLDLNARRKVGVAMRDAARDLSQDLEEPPPRLRAFAGLPRATVARRLFAAVSDELWVA